MTDACAGQRLTGAPDIEVRQVCTDSRGAQPGDLFVALSGERHDGHAFVEETVRQGVAGVVLESSKLPSKLPRCGVIAVENTRRAFGRMAARYRKDFDLPVIAVAGSNGKTTTKNILHAVLKQKFKTLSSQASFNNDIGVPTTILNLDRTHQVAVLEVGTNHPGELASLLDLARPKFGVLTSIGREHLEFFGDLDGVLEEEGFLAESLPGDGKLFVNGDILGLPTILRRARCPAVLVGFGPENHWRASRVRMDEAGSEFSVQSEDPAFCRDFRLPLLGRHQVINALLAVAVGADFGLTPDQVQSGLLACAPAKMRLETCIINGVLVLDDSYNANADSMRTALDALRDFPCSGRRIAVLGDMAELGAHGAAAHSEIGRYVAEIGVEHLLTVGRMGFLIAQAARECGLRLVEDFPDLASAAQALQNLVQPNDVVLLKASRASGLERIRTLLGEALPPRSDMGQSKDPPARG